MERDCLDAEVLLATTNPHEVLSYLERKEGIFFILLELIYSIGVKGTDVAKRIRKKHRESYIVFATKHTSLMNTAFEGLIRPSGFLCKPVSKNDLLAVFMEAYCDHVKMLQKENYFSLNIGSRIYRIPYANINYFEAAQKKIFINTDTQRIGYYDSLEAIGARLDEVFIRCHKGYIVNSKKIESIDFSSMIIYLKDGSSLPVSRTYKEAVRQAAK